MSMTRRQPTPVPLRSVHRWQAHPEVVRFRPHQELVGCLPALVVYAGTVLVGLPALLCVAAAAIGGQAGVTP